jgi:AMP deaminase
MDIAFFETVISSHFSFSLLDCDSARQFVNFVSEKLDNEPDTVVTEDGKTLKELFVNAGLDRDHLTIDAFDVLADYSVYQRFDNFNAKYSPFRMADMRRIFLKTSNSMGGRYFAELMKLVLNRHEEAKGHTSAAEMRLSIYGMERHEWKDLATWMTRDWGGVFPGPVVSTNNRWLIQIPRLWRIFRSKPGKNDRSFLEMLENIFIPLFEATLHPEQHPEIAEALTHIVGFDSVDDEGSAEVTRLVVAVMNLCVCKLLTRFLLCCLRTLLLVRDRKSGQLPEILRTGGSFVSRVDLFLQIEFCRFCRCIF